MKTRMDQMIADDLNDLALLRDLFSDPPDASMERRLEILGRNDARWMTLAQTMTRSTTDALAAEWMRLFEGPGRMPVPLFGSFYLDDGLLMGPSTRAVRTVYATHGLTPTEAIPADHLAFELGFLGFLTTEAAVAGAPTSQLTGQSADQSIRLDQRVTFAEQWMLSWLPAMTTVLREATTLPFFVQLADRTLAVVRQMVAPKVYG